jgi:hypothetical protein
MDMDEQFSGDSFLLPKPDVGALLPGAGMAGAKGINRYEHASGPPLLKGDRADPGEVAREFRAGDKQPLAPLDAAAVSQLFAGNHSDLLNQQFDAAEAPSIQSVYANSGSAKQGTRGGLLEDGAGADALMGPPDTAPQDIGNPRIGQQYPLGSLRNTKSPADTEEVLRKQILESIRTDPAIRLGQSVAISELHQQVNPAAKMGFPVMQTRPKYAEDFVRGRLALPPALQIAPKAALAADRDAHAHVGTLNNLKDV